MDGDKLFLAAGLTVGIGMAAFVFWGPNGSSRLRQRRGQIAGLHNFGKTCFLNALLQSLAACPQFLSWLQLHNTSERKSLITALQNVLEVINGTHPTLRGDPYSPGVLIRTLSSSGWIIPQDHEHDPHELLHVLLSSLEEESNKPKQQFGGLVDALQTVSDSSSEMPPARPSSAMLSELANDEYSESTNFMRMVRSEVHTPDSPHSTCTNDDESIDNSLLDECLSVSTNPPTFASTLPRGFSRHSRKLSEQVGVGTSNGTLHKRTSGSFRSLERLNRGPGRISVWSDMLNMQVPHPFRGGLSSQLVCGACNYKSVVRYDKFDSITLNLPETRNPGLSLGHLLSEYVAPETIYDVKCEHCNEVCSHTKSLTFGKLPPCLCIHISRTTWSPHGHAFKRQDFVHFPEQLSMAPYSFVQPGLSSNAGTPLYGSTLSLYSSSLPNNSDSFGGSMMTGLGSMMFPRNLYRLLAVVVHSGEANTGHFITYRRGALRNSHRWFYTSDTIVKEVPIEDILTSSAYLLFYDRGPSSKLHG